ncbi:MAG: hypothetical protein LUD02_04760 [Tannerellaceae bacterium]|nr:hypothetical protein [Tannerellaceae bacterium]
MSDSWRTNIIKWYDDSFMYRTGNEGYVLLPNRNTLYADFYFDTNWPFSEPISYAEWIELSFYDALRIQYNTIDKSNSWFLYIEDFEYLYQSNMRTETTFTGEENGLLEYRVDITYYSGEKTSFTFKINREGIFSLNLRI